MNFSFEIVNQVHPKWADTLKSVRVPAVKYMSSVATKVNPNKAGFLKVVF